MRRILLTTSGVVIVALFFFGTLFALDFFDRRSRDAARIETAKSIMPALEKYRAAKGAYPVLPVPDSLIKELSGPLVTGGYLGAMPSGLDQTRYASFDGKSFGLWIYLERSGPCKIVVNAPSTGWWGDLPTCQS
jgi:hypothetical protein